MIRASSAAAPSGSPPRETAPGIVAVTCNFPPDAAVGTMRTLRLVRHLAAAGWRVGVVTMTVETMRPGSMLDQSLLARVPEGVRVTRAPALRPFERATAALKGRPLAASAPAPAAATDATASEQPRAGQPTAGRGLLSSIKRCVKACLMLPDRDVSWWLPAVVRGYRLIGTGRCDVIYSSGPPFTAHFVAAALSRLTGTPWVADFRDPWARAPWREDRLEFERRAWGVLERFVVTRAHTVVFTSERNRRDFAEHYGPEHAARFVLIPNGCEATDFAGLTARAGTHGGRVVMLHAGSLYGARSPEGLFRALARAIAKRRIDPERFRLRFIGRPGSVDVQGMARRAGVEGLLEMAGQVPRRDSLQEMLDASALLILQPVTTVAIPAKLYEYLAAGRPILALAEPDGDTAELVLRSGRGIVALAEDDDAVEAALVAVVERAQQPATPISPQLYDGTLRAAELEQVLLAAAARSAPRPLATEAPPSA
jgi:glycosyltransferase involved in cell wall biosynthesis